MANGLVTITWTAPTAGIHHGTLGALTYDVIRIQGCDTTNVATGISSTSCTDDVSAAQQAQLYLLTLTKPQWKTERPKPWRGLPSYEISPPQSTQIGGQLLLRMRFSSASFFRLLLAFRFRLRGHAEELHVVKCSEIGARREQNLRLRDVRGRLEILLLLYGFRGECGAKRPEWTRIHDASLRAKAVQHRTEFVEDSCHIGLSYRIRNII